MSLVTYLLLLSGDFSIMSVPNLCQQDAWMYRIAIFGAYFDLMWRKNIPVETIHFHIFVQISSGYPLIYRSSMTAQGKQNVLDLCTGVSIELHAITLTKAACTMLSFTWQQPNVDFREVQVSVYINRRKSGLNQLGLERAACWKRQEVSGMLITHWNVASLFLFKIRLFGPLA